MKHARLVGPESRIRGSIVKTDVRKNFFSGRVVALWKSLPQNVYLILR